MAVQFARVADRYRATHSIGVIKKRARAGGAYHDCPTLRRGRSGEQWLDVAWDRDISRPFDVNIKLMVANQRGGAGKSRCGHRRSRSEYRKHQLHP